MEQNGHLKDKIRVVTFLCRKQIDFLDQVGKDALFVKGKKISRSQILADLVDLLIESGVSLDKIDFSNGDFAKELLKAIRDNGYKGNGHE